MSGCKNCKSHKCFKKLADESRIKILSFLKEQDANVTQITEFVKLSQPTVSHHLKVLKEYGFIKKRKDKRHIIYSFNTQYPCKSCGVIHL